MPKTAVQTSKLRLSEKTLYRWAPMKERVLLETGYGFVFSRCVIDEVILDIIVTDAHSIHVRK